MVKYFKLFLFLFCVQLMFGQDEKNTIDISFDNTPLTNAITQIERKANVKFYFVEEWIPNKNITANYNKTPLQEILGELFNETILNFYVLDGDKVVLTQNSIIYDELPEGFFRESVSSPVVVNEMENEEQITDSPVFFDTNVSERRTTETVRIGKQNSSNNKRRFTLSGYVRSTETGEPISNLAIIIEGKNTGVSTDINGFYEIDLRKGVNYIETKSLTNENVRKKVIIYNDGGLNFDLRDSYEILGEVFLNSNATKNVDNANTGQEQIDVENIKNIPLVLGERDILKVATTLPGISTAGEGSAGYNVRGGRADQNLILLDNAVLYNPAHFFGIFSAINPFTSGEVNIYKGNIPAKYGGRLSSVFDITTKDSNTEEFQGEASIGPVTSNLSVQIPIVKEKSGLILGGRSTYSDWILKNLDEESLNNSTAFFYDIIAKYNHKFDEKNNLKATGYFSRDQFSITSDSIYSYENRAITLNYNHKFNDKNRGSLYLTNSDYQFNIDYESNFNDNFESGYHLNETQVKFDMEYVHSKKHQFNYGISGKLYQINPGEIKPIGGESQIQALELPSERGLEAAIFISDDFEISEDLLLSAGLRYSSFTALGDKQVRIYEEGVPKSDATVIDVVDYGKNEAIKTYGGPEVRASARYRFTQDLSIKASYNNTIQYIHTLTNNTTVSPTDTYRLSGFDIEPQRAQQYSLGVFKNFDNNVIETSIEGFYKTSNNILDFKVGADLFLNENFETEVIQGEGKSYGAEVLLKKNSGRLNGWLAYTYSRSLLKLDGAFNEEVVNNGEFFPSNFDKPHDFSAVANYKITQRYSLSANFVYQTGRPVTFPVGEYTFEGAEYVVYSDRNQFRIPDYYRLDLSLNIEGSHKLKKLAHTFWNISVYNVLGRNNPYSVFFVNDDGIIEGRQSSIFSVPVPTVSFNFKF